MIKERKAQARGATAADATVSYEVQLWQVADALAGIERDNPAVKNVLLKFTDVQHSA